MKKIIFSLIAVFLSVLSVKAQSIEFHQSYGSDNHNAPYTATRVIVSHFFTSKDEKMNLFTWNSFDRNATNTLLYTEHKLGKKNFYFHPEVRFDYWYGSNNSNSFDFKPMVGFSYLIVKNGVAIYLTPKIMMTYDNVNKWTDPNFQFSINTSYENDKFYYEGYVDASVNSEHSNGKVDLFYEQKAYYKLTDKLQIGGCVVSSVGNLGTTNTDCFIQPYFSMKVNL